MEAQTDAATQRYPRTSIRDRRTRIVPWALTVVVAAVAGCATISEPQDGPPRREVDLASVPDAIPKAEPRSRYGNPSSYTVDGRRYHVRDTAAGYVERGIASWYGRKFHGRRTSSGEPYNMYAMTAAHRSLPLPCYVRVTNLRNGRSIVVRVNDRGPFHDNRIIDLSYAAARKLGIADKGTGLVEVRGIDPDTPRTRWASLDDPPTVDGEVELFVQVGAFASRTNAERLRGRLRSADVTPVRIERGVHEQSPIYRVRVGPLASVDEADRLAASLHGLGLADLRIIID